MKKAIISFLFALSVAVSFGQVGTIFTQTITNSGYTKEFTNTTIPTVVYLKLATNLTLTNDVNVYTSGAVANGKRVTYYINGTPNPDLNGHSFLIEGTTIREDQLKSGLYVTLVSDGVDWSVPFICTSFDASSPVPTLSGVSLQDSTVPLAALQGLIPQSSIDTTGRGRIWYGNATNQTSTLFAGGNGKVLIGDGTDVNSVSVSGDIAITSAGVTSIAAGSIVNADVNASAAIAVSKLAALTASKPVVTDGSGVLTTTNQVPANYGGTGQDFSASTGFQKWSAGTASVAAITDVRDLHVSFAANSQGTYYITFPVAVTVTNIEARVETAIAGTDDATLEIQDNSGTDMTGNNLTAGLLTLAASATTGTGYTSTLLSNNTFSAGQRMRIISAKTTAGGTINVQVTYTRNE